MTLSTRCQLGNYFFRSVSEPLSFLLEPLWNLIRRRFWPSETWKPFGHDWIIDRSVSVWTWLATPLTKCSPPSLRTAGDHLQQRGQRGRAESREVWTHRGGFALPTQRLTWGGRSHNKHCEYDSSCTREVMNWQLCSPRSKTTSEI